MKLKTICFLILLLILNSKFVASQASIDDADNLFYSLELKRASESYLKIFQDDNSKDEDRALAGRKLSFISWHFYNDIEKAREYAQKSIEFKKYEAYIFQDLINYESEAKNYIKAKEVYQQALSKLETDDKLNMLFVAYSEMILDEAADKIINKQPLDTILLNDALQKIEKVNKEEPGNLSSAKIQLGLALLQKNGNSALKAWRLYYHVADSQKSKGLLSEPEKELTEVFTAWNKTNLNKEDREKLILNLATSRFYQYAYLLNKYLANDTGVENPKIADISNYYEFCNQIEEHTFKYYKDIAINNENNISDLKKDLDGIQEELWDKLYWHDKKPKYSKKNFQEEIYKRFGTKLFEKKLNGRYFYIGGHNIIDTIRVVEQFGHKEKIHFIVLDNRFSNNYWGWFTGYIGFAGYADESQIIRYREPVSSNPIYFWNKLTDNELLVNWQKQIAQQTIKDDSIAFNNTDAYLPGIYNRIQFNVYSSILDSLKNCGVKESDLRMHFLSVLNEIRYSSNINHEGRHVIDFNHLSKIKLGNDTELEYRAMLSQIYFAQYPFLEIRFDIDNTPHGLARKKILHDIINWMEHNKDLINGFDINRPTITQIDLLTNNQIKEIIRSVEPFLN